MLVGFYVLWSKFGLFVFVLKFLVGIYFVFVDYFLGFIEGGEVKYFNIVGFCLVLGIDEVFYSVFSRRLCCFYVLFCIWLFGFGNNYFFVFVGFCC